MQSVASAAYDPVFYMHHAFVDYVWELFRRRQFRRCGIDPAHDYPELSLSDSHHADARMIGFDWFTNRDGIKYDWIDNWYDYESTPSCPNCCESCSFPAPVYCDRQRGVCVARSRRSFAFGPFDASSRRRAQLEPKEMHSLQHPLPPRNRGREFQGPTSDGRTIFSAIDNTFDYLQRQEEQTLNNSDSLYRTSYVHDASLPDYIDQIPDQRRPRFSGSESRSGTEFKMSSRSGRTQILSDSARVSSEPRSSAPERGGSNVYLLTTESRLSRQGPGSSLNRPASISDSPVLLTDVRIPTSRSLTSVRSSSETRNPRLPASQRIGGRPRSYPESQTDLQMSSFDMPAAPTDRGTSSASTSLDYTSPEMSLYERSGSYQDPMVLPDRRGSTPVGRQQYLENSRSLPDSRKVLISRIRRIEPATSRNSQNLPEQTLSQSSVSQQNDMFRSRSTSIDRQRNFTGRRSNFDSRSGRSDSLGRFGDSQRTLQDSSSSFTDSRSHLTDRRPSDSRYVNFV